MPYNERLFRAMPWGRKMGSCNNGLFFVDKTGWQVIMVGFLGILKWLRGNGLEIKSTRVLTSWFGAV
jgi:hypothetical protein